MTFLVVSHKTNDVLFFVIHIDTHHVVQALVKFLSHDNSRKI